MNSSQDGSDTGMQVPIVRLFDIPVHAYTLTSLLDRIGECISSGTHLHLGVVNAAKIVNMQRDPLLDKAVRASDIIVADGQSVVWASRLMNRPLPERVAGIDVMMGILAQGNRLGYRVYCLGATEEVSLAVTDRLATEYPGIEVVGRHDGYFTEKGAATVVEDIVNAAPDVLFVAMSSPKKEEFLARWQELQQVKVIHGVGGSFDVFSGRVKRAPLRWQQYGLEWLYRLCQEPRRMWRRVLVTNTLFIWMLVKALLTRRN